MWMAVEPLFKPFLVDEMADESNTSAKNKETIQGSVLNVLISLLFVEETAVAEKVDKANRDTPAHTITCLEFISRKGVEGTRQR